MFINCPHCRALVATDPATDLPPPRCPRCAVQLRDDASETAVAAPALPTSAAPAASDAAPGEPAQDAPADVALDAPSADADAAPPEAVTTSTPSAAPTKTAPGFTFARLLRRRAVDAAPTAAAAGAGPDVDGLTPTTPVVRETPPRRVYAVVPMPDVGRDTPATPGPAARASAASDAASQAERMPLAVTPDDPAPPGPGTATGAALSAPPTAPSKATPPADAGPDALRAPHAPSFARGRAAAGPASRREQWTLAAAIAGLSLLLAVQWVVADRETLAADARWRPLVQHVCAALRCAVPPWREPSALVLLDRDVRPDASVADALRVTATFRNDASWPQAWPLLQLTLSDVDGITVAEGTFAAADYLGAAPSQPLLAPGQVATVRMVVAEPTPRSVAFAFAFR